MRESSSDLVLSALHSLKRLPRADSGFLLLMKPEGSITAMQRKDRHFQEPHTSPKPVLSVRGEVWGPRPGRGRMGRARALEAGGLPHDPTH